MKDKDARREIENLQDEVWELQRRANAFQALINDKELGTTTFVHHDEDSHRADQDGESMNEYLYKFSIPLHKAIRLILDHLNLQVIREEEVPAVYKLTEILDEDS